jgi:GNAT superfamily N-acetyltransferase
MTVTPLTNPRRPAWLATGPDGRPLGVASLWTDTGDLDINVHPAERRSGVGTRLLQAVTEAAIEQGLPHVRTDAVAHGSAAEAFCLARGFRAVLRLTYTRLALDGERATAAPAPGYRLIHWDGTVPGELAETFARSRRAMDDMPMGEAAATPEPWTVERLHYVAGVVAERGDILCTTAAVAADGEIAGFTELVVPGDGAGDAQHYGTGVLPEHRGHGLARWMKAEQINRTRGRFPRLAGLLADTADDNAVMRRVNESLGYRPTHRSALLQLDLNRP